MDAGLATVLAAGITATLGAAGLLGAAFLTFLSSKRTREAEAAKLSAQHQQAAAELERDDEAAARQRETARREQLDDEYRQLREREQVLMQRLTDDLDRERRRSAHLQQIIDSRSGDV